MTNVLPFHLHDLSDGPQIQITHQSRKTNIHDYFISTYFRRGMDLLDEGIKEVYMKTRMRVDGNEENQDYINVLKYYTSRT